MSGAFVGSDAGDACGIGDAFEATCKRFADGAAVMPTTMRSVLAISGSDSSGGAGMQADIKTIAAHGLFAQSALTALTAQNTTGVYDVASVDPDFVAKQIDVVFDDIRPDAVKIGMIPSAEVAHAIAEALVRNDARNIVVDPVMVATSGCTLSESAAVQAVVRHVFPLATVVVPNIPEAEVLASMEISSRDDMRRAAFAIARMIGGARLEARADCEVGGAGVSAAGREFRGLGSAAEACSEPSVADMVDFAGEEGLAVLIKGGHGFSGDACCADGLGGSEDLLLDSSGDITWLFAPRIGNPNTHGTGCTLSSAIACGLAEGMTLEDSCIRAKDYISGALSAGLDLGRGAGPINHMWAHL